MPISKWLKRRQSGTDELECLQENTVALLRNGLIPLGCLILYTLLFMAEPCLKTAMADQDQKTATVKYASTVSATNILNMHVVDENPASIQYDLGLQPEPLTTATLARELLLLMARSPEKQDHQLYYMTTEAVVAFIYNQPADSLTRIQRRSDGQGSSEVWTGDVRYRLNSAVDGGSLDDTPAGKSASILKTF